jgi:aminoglycoside 3-N-acetyltransferase
MGISRLIFRLWIVNNCPSWLLNAFRRGKRSSAVTRVKSTLRLWRLKSASSALSSDDLVRDLQQLGVPNRGKLMVHSSLSGLGFVAGGAPTVIQALLHVIGPDGLVAMPCPPVTGLAIESLRGGMPFDPRTTPCTTGTICESFRQWPGVFRSWHPTHSVAALGVGAEWLVRDHHLDPTPFGPQSPFARLVEVDGYILGIGLDVRWITFYHYFEDSCTFFPVKVYSREILNLPVTPQPGLRILVSTPHHDPLVAAFRLNNDPQTLAAFDRALDHYSDIRRGPIGRGHGYLVQARSLLHAMQSMLDQDGQTIYNLGLLRKTKPEAFR